MATVIEFPTRRSSAAPLASRAAYDDALRFKPRKPPAANPMNRYDAALKGYMAKRANQLCWELDWAMHPHGGTQDDRHARINWVIDQIKAMREEVARTTPEHHPPAAS